MTITLIIIVAVLAVFLGWILSQSFNVRPWVAAGPSASTQDQLPPFFTAPRVGIAVFLAAVSSLFGLTISAYNMRMGIGDDWMSVPAPDLMWFNTAALVAGSVAFHWAWRAAARDNGVVLRRGLWAGGICTLLFVVGQYIVWLELHGAGYYLTTNPANSFFYLVTALHALHLIGGLGVWAYTMNRARRGESPQQLRTSIELCTVYWHYLLVLWAVLFGLLLST